MIGHARRQGDGNRVGRLRAALRIANEPRVVAILRELIIDTEKRPVLIEQASAKSPRLS
jgi:hypothetical protein